MKFFHKLEYKYGKYAIHNLMYYIVILYALGLVMNLINPMFYWVYLSLDIGKVLHGQIWRLVTFLVYPPTLATWAFMDIFFGILALFMYHSLGLTLERADPGGFCGVCGISRRLFYYHRIFEFFHIPGLCHLFPGCAVSDVYGDPGEGEMAGHCGDGCLCLQFFQGKRKHQM